MSGQKREIGMRSPEVRRKRRGGEETKATLGLWVNHGGQMADFPRKALPGPRSVGIRGGTVCQLRNSL